MTQTECRVNRHNCSLRNLSYFPLHDVDMRNIMSDALYFNSEGRNKIQRFREKTKGGEWDWSLLSNAIIDYYDGLKINSKYSHLWLNAAYALHLAGFKKEADTCLEKGISLDPVHQHTLEVSERILNNYPFNEGIIRPNIPPRHFQQINEYANKIIILLRRGGPIPNKKVFIVHGHDQEAKWELESFLRDIGLEPIILHKMDGGGLTIIEKFEKYAIQCDFAVVLLTADDPLSEFESHNAEHRARPNVIMELGYFLGRLGRQRVALLRKGNVEIHSDILGIEYIPIDDGVEAAGEKIRKRLREVGYAV